MNLSLGEFHNAGINFEYLQAPTKSWNLSDKGLIVAFSVYA